MKVHPILNQIIKNQKQNQKLIKLRDWLLPMLMNGQVKVADAQEQIDELMVAEPEQAYGES
jgi:type I restriction enzyme S subunit